VRDLDARRSHPNRPIEGGEKMKEGMRGGGSRVGGGKWERREAGTGALGE
jgi:hypothetical protein